MRKSARVLSVFLLAGLLAVPAYSAAMGGGNKPEQAKPAAAQAAPSASPAAGAAPAAAPVADQKLVASSSVASASAPASPITGGEVKAMVTFLKGIARVQPKGAAKYTNLSLGAILSEGDTVITLDNARMEIKLDTGQIIRLGPATSFTLQAMRKTSTGGIKGILKVVTGRLWFTLGKLTGDSDLKTQTPTVVAAVKGTVYSAEVAKDGQTSLQVYDGVVSASRDGASPVDVAANEKLVAMANAEFEKGSIDEVADDKDDFIRWNKSRDKLRVMIIIPETRGEEKATASVSENAAMKRFMNNYLFKVIEKDQVDRIREGEKLKAALKGDNAAAAAAGLEIGADLIVVGQAVAKYFKSPALGGLVSATANMTLRAVRADTAEVIAASSDIVSRQVDITDEGAAFKALAQAGEKAGSQFIDSIMAKWRREVRKGAGLDVTVDGVTFSTLKTVRNALAEINGVSEVQQLYLVGKRALLNVTYKGDTASLAEAIEGASFGGLRVSVVGLSAYKLEIEVAAPRAGAAPAAAPAAPAKVEEAPKPAAETAPAAAPAPAETKGGAQ